MNTLNWHIRFINVNVSIGVESKCIFIYMDGLIHVKKNIDFGLYMFYTIVYWLTLAYVHLHSLTPLEQGVPKVSVQPVVLGMTSSKCVTYTFMGPGAYKHGMFIWSIWLWDLLCGW
jgi:hypothetical protein